MEATEKGTDKVKKICEMLREETLQPAMNEAKKILDDAKKDREKIIEEARAKAAKIIAEAEKEIDQRFSVFKASLNQAARQSIAWLKQEIEERVLKQNLEKIIANATSSPEILADLIKALIKAIEQEGLGTDVSAVIPSVVEVKAINELLGKEVLEKLKEKSVLIGPQKGGVELKLHKEKITIDLSDKALLELMIRYVRKDFHQYFFASK